MKPILHFAHANSYPAATYRVLLDDLRRHYDVRALALHAHNPAYPVDDGWMNLARELVDVLAASYTQPVILVGHSLGGMLSLMAAKARPDLVRCVVMLDSPIVAGWRAAVLRLAKMLGASDRFPPVKLSARRRNLWPDKDAVHKHFASKPVFARWAPEVLRDYVEHGFVSHPQGLGLRFSRDTETAIYRTLPHHIGALVKHPFPVPVGFIGGIDSEECRTAGLAATKRLVGKHFQQLPGGHLFPMESPALTARAVHEMIISLLSK